MDADTFRVHGHRLIDWVADFLEHIEDYPVLARVKPGDVKAALPHAAPEHPETFEQIFQDFERVLLPGVTHWNHPGFLAYFAISSSGPGILAELLTAALNSQAMLWRTGPSATELEEVALGWLRDLMGLPAAFEGVIYDTASISTLHALTAAREVVVPEVKELGLAGRPEISRAVVYCSDEAHSSIDKAVMLMGLGRRSVRRIQTDQTLRMRSDALSAAIADDRIKGRVPMAVVATIGTTSTTSIDPTDAIAEICQRERLWLHIDAAYGGVAAIVPDMRHVLAGADLADSLVVNPHKWLFTPFDLSVLYCKRMDAIRAAFSLVPAYLQTTEQPGARNLMDTGIQLGRKFRALKLWAILRYFGAEGIRARLAEHMRLARLFAEWVDADERFERLVPVPFSVVCFRACPTGRSEPELNDLNQRLLDAVNATGDVFLSHTMIRNRFALRVAVGNIRTTEKHVRRAWEILREELGRLQALGSGLQARSPNPEA